MAAPVVCPGVLLAVAGMVVVRQAAWHLAICSKAYLVVTAVPWAHIKWVKTRRISWDSRASRARLPGGSSDSQQPPSMGSQGPGPMGQDSSGSHEESSTSGVPSMHSQRRSKSGFQGGSGGRRMKGGNLLGGGRSSSKIVAKLEKASDSYRWAAATTGSQQAAGYQLASEKPVMAIGGFNGSDPYPSLEQFKQYVKDKQIHYYIAGEMGGHQMGGSDTATQISQWVAKHYTATTVDGVTVYDLTKQQAS